MKSIFNFFLTGLTLAVCLQVSSAARAWEEPPRYGTCYVVSNQQVQERFFCRFIKAGGAGGSGIIFQRVRGSIQDPINTGELGRANLPSNPSMTRTFTWGDNGRTDVVSLLKIQETTLGNGTRHVQTIQIWLKSGKLVSFSDSLDGGE